MEDKRLQSIRYKLQRRVRRLNSANWEQFIPFLRQFFVYFNSSPILCGVRDDLASRGEKYKVKETVEKIVNGENLYGENEEEAAAIGNKMLLHVVKNEIHDFENILLSFRLRQGGGEMAENLDVFREEFLEPFYEYIDEHIDDQHVILYLLGKYKHRCEWFHSESLRQNVINDTSKGEKNLALDLYEYLHDSGIDFNIEPKSASGIPDFVTEQIDDNRIIADTKIYWPEKSKNKSYLIHGFNQIYTYLCDFNESFGYLVIYNLTDDDIRFLLPQTQSAFPSYTYNNKTVFFVLVDIFDHEASASKRGQRKTVDIAENELIEENSSE